MFPRPNAGTAGPPEPRARSTSNDNDNSISNSISISISNELADRTQHEEPGSEILDTSQDSEVPTRIFPIRSIISVAAPSAPRTNLPRDDLDEPHNVADQATTPVGDDQTATATTEPEHRYITRRLQHVVTDNGHAVLAGDGAPLQNCEDEPIHAPGSVQGFGVLVCLRRNPQNDEELVVRVASENSTQTLGYSPTELFGLASFCDIMGSDEKDNFLDQLDFTHHEPRDLAVDGPAVFLLSLNQPEGSVDAVRNYWCAVHVNPKSEDLIICEFELEDDKQNPLTPPDGTQPVTPRDTLGMEPTPDELASSTTKSSRPLRALRRARRKHGGAYSMEVFDVMFQIQEQLARAPTIDALANIATGLVKELTGFHRVVVYQFDQEWNGMVTSELVDPHITKDLYKGLRFPASDIPKQARDLYMINKVRLLYDRDQDTARLVCRTAEDLQSPIDLTHAYLRAMSPIHLKYLGNMGVRSSMSISICAFNQLWGLISCHAYANAGMRVAFPLRRLCRLIGDNVSRNLERLSYAVRLQARQLINTATTESNPGYIIASSEELLKLFEADFGALSIRSETMILGKGTPHTQEILAFVEYLRIRRLSSVMASKDIAKNFPDLRYPPGFQHIGGLLYVPLSVDASDFIVFFRRPQLTELKWAGNPYEKHVKQGTAGFLEPRKSFKIWRETVRSQSRGWSDADLETAAVLCLVYGKFIQVWRQKEAVVHRSRLTRLLIANSAHEIRTPLNAIINYLEIAMEASLDTDTRDHLTRSHSASKSLVYVINDLLDLTSAERSNNLIKDEAFDLFATAKEASGLFVSEANRKGLSYTITVQPDVPCSVLGDQRRVRQMMLNLISNAIQYTSAGFVAVDVCRRGVTLGDSDDDPEGHDGHVRVELSVTDTGRGMSQGALQGLFHELEQVSSEAVQLDHDSNDEQQSAAGSQAELPGQRDVLGLGLALVARLIHQLNGQLSVKSQEGKGSCFKIALEFPLPESEVSSEQQKHISMQPQQEEVPVLQVPRIQEPTTTASIAEEESAPPTADGKFKLVGRRSYSAEWQRRRRSSGGSGRSLGSVGRSHSEADRLINSIQEPFILRRSASEGAEEEKRDSACSFSLRKYEQKSQDICQSVSPSVPTVTDVSESPTLLDSPSEASQVTSLHPHPMPDSRQETTPSVPTLSTSESLQIKTPRVGPLPAPPATNTTTTATTITTTTSATASQPSKSTPLRVLVAEDDPINSKIIQKRLKMLGHTVHLTVDGSECAHAFRTDPNGFDVVLMDIQMPLVDGLSATNMIREIEQEQRGWDCGRPRVPVFAVSATLMEAKMQMYIDAGFDGWIMKPVDSKRLGLLLDGMRDEDVRSGAVYQPGHWEKGGWLLTAG